MTEEDRIEVNKLIDNRIEKEREYIVAMLNMEACIKQLDNDLVDSITDFTSGRPFINSENCPYNKEEK